MSELGCPHEIADPVRCIQIEPALAPVGSRIAGGLFCPDDEIGDAFKFTESGSICVQVELRKKDGDEIQLDIKVIDSGPGMAPNKLNQIFDAFSQEDTSITRRYGGTGLGLAISRGLANY